MAALKFEDRLIKETGVKIVLSDKEKDTLAGARRILKDLWADDKPGPCAQGTHVVIINPSYDKVHPETYNGKIDAYDAAEVIEYILQSVGFYDDDMCDD